MSNRSVSVIGAGAAGLMASIFAAAAGARVILLDGTKECGRKILISGGGRCNVLPKNFGPDDFWTDSSRNTLRKILATWPGQDQRSFFENELGVPLKLEEESEKFFPVSDRARDVKDALVRRAEALGVEIRLAQRVLAVEKGTGGEPGWKVNVARGSQIAVDSVVVATGGLSVPKTGSDGWGLDFAKRLGLAVETPYPALTPLFADPHPLPGLSGITVSAGVASTSPTGTVTRSGGFLITHKGFSGPAVLDVSHIYTRDPEHAEVTVNFLNRPVDEIDEMFRGGRGTVGGVLRRILPDRLVESLCEKAGVGVKEQLGRFPKGKRQALIRVLAGFPLCINGSGGFKMAEVTGGGVSLKEVKPNTMECRRHPGLFFCGEVLDAFGPIGGFNFAWAWITGRLAGVGAGRGD